MAFGWLRKTNDLETLSILARAAAEGAQKAEIRRAISTIKNIDSDDDVEYSGFASSELAKKIIEKAGVKCPSSDDLYAGGIFVFVIANHISYMLEVPFEDAATLGTMVFLASNGMSVDDASLSVGPISRTYNSLAQSSGNNRKYILAVGQNVVTWCKKPSDENMEKLVKLYSIGRENLGAA